MKRYELADGMLQFLNALAWIAGLVWLVGAVILMTNEQVLSGIAVGLTGVLSAVALLAFGYVGRAVIDIAHNTSLARDERLVSPPPVAPPPPAVRPAPPAPLPVSGYDERRWGFLKEVDSEIAAAASRVSALGPRYEQELAERFLVLGDRSYLTSIEKVLTDRVEQERRRQDELVASIDSEQAESVRREAQSYQAIVEANGNVDPAEKVPVVRIEPYTGKWRAGQGGIKVTLANGKFVLRKGGFARVFGEDPDAATGSAGGAR